MTETNGRYGFGRFEGDRVVTSDPAETFLATLRESLAEFDRRLTDLERLGGLVHESLKVLEARLDELDAHHDEVTKLRQWAKGEEPEHNDDFLAPPLPWWARSPKVG